MPGWNAHVKQLYAESRDAFLFWRSSGSPRVGPVAQYMRRSRANFKFALRQCRANENAHRAEALSMKLQRGNIRSFWRDLHSANRSKELLAQRIDNATSEPQIAQLWKDKYCAVYNSIDDEQDRQMVQNRLSQPCVEHIEPVTVHEMQQIVSRLSLNKSVGMDGIPAEFFTFCSMNILVRLSMYFSAFLAHSFLPNTLTDVLLVPLAKSKLKDPCDSSNYRPIAMANAASKVFEMIILNRLRIFLNSSDNQFGFKKNHSTELCVMALKEVVRYYLGLNTPIFICFLDIRSAFDKMSYCFLMQTLL